MTIHRTPYGATGGKRNARLLAKTYCPGDVDASKLPASVDWRNDPRMPEVWNQYQVGVCAAEAMLRTWMFQINSQKPNSAFGPSELFSYFNARARTGTTGEDCGSSLSDESEASETCGVVPRGLWPLDPDKVTVRPPDGVYTVGLTHQTLQHEAVVAYVLHIQKAIADGYLVAFCLPLRASFESPEVARTGQVPNPRRGEPVVGYHAMTLCGYMTTGMWWWKRLTFLVANSWSNSWGASGYCYIDASYIMGEGSDFQKISEVEI